MNNSMAKIATVIKTQSISVPVPLARSLDNCSDALILSQILYWHLPAKANGSKLRVNKDGVFWLAKGYADWEPETGINEFTARNSIRRLKERGLIATKIMRFAGVPTVHIRLIWDAVVRLIDPFCQNQSIETTNLVDSTNINELETTNIDDSETTNIDELETTNINDSYTETTYTEITTEITKSGEGESDRFFEETPEALDQKPADVITVTAVIPDHLDQKPTDDPVMPNHLDQKPINKVKIMPILKSKQCNSDRPSNPINRIELPQIDQNPHDPHGKPDTPCPECENLTNKFEIYRWGTCRFCWAKTRSA